MTQLELNARANQVFDLLPGDFVYQVYIDDNNRFVMDMSEYDSFFKDHVCFKYFPDMSERPQALAYLMGEREDFND